MKLYFDYLEMYNCYKHGNRVAYLSSPEDGEEPYGIEIYFPPGKERNTATIKRVGDVAPLLNLANDIIEISSCSKRNWLSRKRNESADQFTIEFPMQRDDEEDSSLETGNSVA